MSDSSDLWFSKLTDTALRMYAQALLQVVEFRTDILRNTISALWEIERQTPFPEVSNIARLARERLSDTVCVQGDLAQLYSISYDAVSWRHYEVACLLTIKDVFRISQQQVDVPNATKQEVMVGGYCCIVPNGNFKVHKLFNRHILLHEKTTLVIDSDSESLTVDLVNYGPLPFGAVLEVSKEGVFVNGVRRNPLVA